MFGSIWSDIKSQYQSGNMITKIIITCLAVFISFSIIDAISASFSENAIQGHSFFWQQMALPSNLLATLKQPWSIVTHMFMHDGLWQTIFNLLWLYFFGRIVGDLLGDQRVLPIYIMSTLFGATFFWLYHAFSPSQLNFAVGAPTAVCGIITAAAFTAPDYVMRFPLVGDIRIKWIAGIYIALTVISAFGAPGQQADAFAHLGGVAFGALFVTQLKNGNDFTLFLQNWFKSLSNFFANKDTKPKKTVKKSPLKVAHHAPQRESKKTRRPSKRKTFNVDDLLDKIRQNGIESLSDEEKKFLDDASKEL